jgi:hypothetical protein
MELSRRDLAVLRAPDRGPEWAHPFIIVSPTSERGLAFLRAYAEATDGV